MTSQSYDAGSLVRYYYVKDHIGNIRQTLDHSGTIVAAQDYYSYGEYIRSYNQGLPNDRYKFTGKERDNESNLDYFGARYYESSSGRWLSVDPMANKYPGWSPYVYCHNNPLRLIDPNGMEDGGPGFFAWLKNFFIGNSSNETNPGTEINRTIVEETKIMSKKIGEFPRKTVKATENYADATSDASTKVSIAGVAAAPLTAGVFLEGSADALVIETIADGVSLGAKTVDFIAFGGSKVALINQGVKFGADIIGGKVIDAVADKVVTETGLNTAAYGNFTEGLKISTEILLGIGF